MHIGVVVAHRANRSVGGVVRAHAPRGIGRARDPLAARQSRRRGANVSVACGSESFRPESKGSLYCLPQSWVSPRAARDWGARLMQRRSPQSARKKWARILPVLLQGALVSTAVTRFPMQVWM